MFFDAVLDMDDDMNPVFNGTPEETAQWLHTNYVIDGEHAADLNYVVYMGRNCKTVSIEAYLNGKK